MEVDGEHQQQSCQVLGCCEVLEHGIPKPPQSPVMHFPNKDRTILLPLLMLLPENQFTISYCCCWAGLGLGKSAIDSIRFGYQTQFANLASAELALGLTVHPASQSPVPTTVRTNICNMSGRQVNIGVTIQNMGGMRGIGGGGNTLFHQYIPNQLRLQPQFLNGPLPIEIFPSLTIWAKMRLGFTSSQPPTHNQELNTQQHTKCFIIWLSLKRRRSGSLLQFTSFLLLLGARNHRASHHLLQSN